MSNQKQRYKTSVHLISTISNCTTSRSYYIW